MGCHDHSESWDRFSPPFIAALQKAKKELQMLQLEESKFTAINCTFGKFLKKILEEQFPKESSDIVDILYNYSLVSIKESFENRQKILEWVEQNSHSLQQTPNPQLAQQMIVLADLERTIFPPFLKSVLGNAKQSENYRFTKTAWLMKPEWENDLTKMFEELEVVNMESVLDNGYFVEYEITTLYPADFLFSSFVFAQKIGKNAYIGKTNKFRMIVKRGPNGFPIGVTCYPIPGAHPALTYEIDMTNVNLPDPMPAASTARHPTVQPNNA